MAHVIAPNAQIGADLSRCRPLIVDPYLSNRTLLRETLAEMGCSQVLDCSRLRDAVLSIENDHPNILFVDWSKQTNALEFLRMLRHHTNPHRFLPVVVMTAFASLDHIAQIRDAGATEIMVRPWSRQMVASRMRSIALQPRLYIQGGGFFGPDRRRRRLEYMGQDRRRHENWQEADRRHAETGRWDGPERRQGRSGFMPLERRDAPRT